MCLTGKLPTRAMWQLRFNNKMQSFLDGGLNLGPGARFSKVPIINGPGMLSPFTLKIEVSIVLHLI